MEVTPPSLGNKRYLCDVRQLMGLGKAPFEKLVLSAWRDERADGNLSTRGPTHRLGVTMDERQKMRIAIIDGNPIGTRNTRNIISKALRDNLCVKRWGEAPNFVEYHGRTGTTPAHYGLLASRSEIEAIEARVLQLSWGSWGWRTHPNKLVVFLTPEPEPLPKEKPSRTVYTDCRETALEMFLTHHTRPDILRESLETINVRLPDEMDEVDPPTAAEHLICGLLSLEDGGASSELVKETARRLLEETRG